MAKQDSASKKSSRKLSKKIAKLARAIAPSRQTSDTKLSGRAPKSQHEGSVSKLKVETVNTSSDLLLPPPQDLIDVIMDLEEDLVESHEEPMVLPSLAAKASAEAPVEALAEALAEEILNSGANHDPAFDFVNVIADIKSWSKKELSNRARRMSVNAYYFMNKPELMERINELVEKHKAEQVSDIKETIVCVVNKDSEVLEDDRRKGAGAPVHTVSAQMPSDWKKDWPTAIITNPNNWTLVTLKAMIDNMGIFMGSSKYKTKDARIGYINDHILKNNQKNCNEAYRCEPKTVCNAMKNECVAEVDAPTSSPESFSISVMIVDGKEYYYGSGRQLRELAATKGLPKERYVINAIQNLQESSNDGEIGIEDIQQQQEESNIQSVIDEIVKKQGVPEVPVVPVLEEPQVPVVDAPAVEEPSNEEESVISEASESSPTDISVEPVVNVEIIPDSAPTPALVNVEQPAVQVPVVERVEPVAQEVVPQPSMVEEPPTSVPPPAPVEQPAEATIVKAPQPVAQPVAPSSQVKRPPITGVSTPKDLKTITQIVNGRKPLTDSEARVAAVLRRALAL
jgi:hypothetical protein